MRRGILRQLGAAAMTLVFATSAAANEKPNILFIFSDDHTAQALGAYRNALDYGLKLNHSPTPNLDRLAEQGMRFDNAFVTNSICKPSRAAVLTGTFGHVNGVKTNVHADFDAGQTTFPALLQEAGYQTAIVGKWHLGTQPQGFDYWEVLAGRGGQGHYYNPTMWSASGKEEIEGHTSRVIADRTMNWLANDRDSDEPFLMMMQFKTAHRNWMPAPQHLRAYRDRVIPEPSTLFYDYDGLASPASEQRMEIGRHTSWGWDLKLPRKPHNDEEAGAFRGVKYQMNDGQFNDWQQAYKSANERFYQLYSHMDDRMRTRWRYQRYIKDYLRTVRGMDENIGRVLDYLERTGQAENTIVIYSADQGFFLGENGWFDKRWMYEESFRTPLIVKWPETIEPGSTDEHLVQNLAFAQTMLDMAGVSAPSRMQGRSLVPLMTGEEPESWREALYYQYFEGANRVHGVARHVGVRTDRYKLIHYYTRDEWELFDLQRDPEELYSVYDDPQYRGVRERMKNRLESMQEKYDAPDPLPTAEDN